VTIGEEWLRAESTIPQQLAKWFEQIGFVRM
jgi:hypothetical protein